MVSINVVETFKFAERGIDIFEYLKGETVEVSDECAEIALENKWAEKAKDGEQGKKKTKPVPQIIDEQFVERETAALSSEQLEIK